MKKLFQYAVLLHEYKQVEGGKREYVDSKVIIEPKFAMGKSENDILFKVTREIPEEHASNPDDVQILIRNF